MKHRTAVAGIGCLALLMLLVVWMPVAGGGTLAQADPTATALPPEDWVPITVENVDQLEPVKTLGRGLPREARWSPDGDWLAVQASTNVWLYPDGDLSQPPQRVIGEDFPVISFAFHPNGDQIVTGHDGGVIMTWDLVDGAVSSVFMDDQRRQAVFVLAFSPDGTRQAVGYGSSVVLRDTATGQFITAISPGKYDYLSLKDIRFSPDSSMMATTFAEWSDDGGQSDVRLWDSQTGAPIETLAEWPAVDTLRFSPDGQLLVGLCAGDSMWVWNLTSPEEKDRDLWFDQRITALDFLPDSHTLFLAEWPNHVYPSGRFVLYDLDTDTSRPLISPGDSTNTIASIAFHPGGARLVLASREGFIQHWQKGADWIDMVSLGAFPHFNAYVTQVALDSGPDIHILALEDPYPGTWLGSGTTLRLWDTAAGTEIEILRQDGMVAFCTSPDGRWAAVRDKTGSILIYDLASGFVADRQQPFTDYWGTAALAFSPDSTRLAAGNEDEGLRVWNLPADPDGHIELVETVEDVVAVGAAFSPDGSTIAVGGEGTVSIWDGERETFLFRQSKEGISFDFWAVAYDPTGQYLVAAGGAYYHMGREGSGIYVFDTSGGEYTVLESYESPVNAIALSPDGDLLASADEAGVTLWSMAEYETVYKIRMRREAADVTFSADGRLMVVASDDGTIRLWGVSALVE